MARKTNGNGATGDERLGLLEFPCRFPIKAMGRQDAEFEALVSGIILRHAQLWPGEAIRSTPSKAGRFVSVTVVVRAESQEQLDAIYHELSDCAQVLVAL
jgi:putative lipoic acid-binding regulatory protein